MDEKAIWGLAGALLGWLLSVGTAFVKEEMRVWRLASGLRDELEDIDHQANDMVESQRRNLQMVGRQGCAATGALPIQHVFFEKAYPEVFSKIGRGSRLSLQLIHASVDGLNEQAEKLDSIFLELDGMVDRQSETANVRIRQWNELVAAAFTNAMSLRWYIKRHLDGLFINPVQHYGEDHRAWLRHLDRCELEIQKFIEEGKKLPAGSSEPYYQAENFDANARREKSSSTP